MNAQTTQKHHAEYLDTLLVYDVIKIVIIMKFDRQHTLYRYYLMNCNKLGIKMTTIELLIYRDCFWVYFSLQLDNNDELSVEEKATTGLYLEESGFGMFRENKKRLAVQHLLFHFLFVKRFHQLVSIRKGINSIVLADFLGRNPDQVSSIFPAGPVPLTWQHILRRVRYEDVPHNIQDWFEQYLRDLDSSSQGMITIM